MTNQTITPPAGIVLTDRCAHCYRPFAPGEPLAGVGFFSPDEAPHDPVAYALCKFCAGPFRRSAGRKRASALAKIEAYVMSNIRQGGSDFQHG